MKNKDPKKFNKAAGRHYDFLPVETIKIIEAVVSRECIDRRAAYCVGNALKYLLRLGVKPGESVQDDITKAKNYLNRAITGEWEVKK